MQFKAGSKDVIEFKNTDIESISFLHYLQASAAGTAISVPAVNWSKINVKLLLTQKGKTIQIYSGQLLPVMMAQAFAGADWEYLSPVTGTQKLLTTVANASGVKQVSYLNGKFELGTVLNLRGSDSLEVTVSMESDVYDTSVDSGVSYCNVIANKGIGLQYSVPQWDARVLTTSDETPKFNLGDNVKQIFFINSDKQTILKTDQIVKNVRIYSDRYQAIKTYEELLSERVEQFETSATSADRSQNFAVFVGAGEKEMDKVSVELDVDVANINTGKNYLVTQSYYVDAQIVEKANIRFQKHTRSYLRKLRK